LARTPQAKAAFDEWRERLVDLAESKLWEAVERGESWAIGMVLKTQGRHRGWSELSPTANAQAMQQATDGVRVYLPLKDSDPLRIKLKWDLDEAGARVDPAADLPGPADAAPVVDEEDEIGGEEISMLRTLTEKLHHLERRQGGDR
jgi:hypothetical protein